jgi:hypothetical protein
VNKTGRVVAGSITAAALALGLSAHANADITPNHDSMITTNACEDILLGWSDGQTLDNLSKKYGVSSQQALRVITEMRLPGNCVYDENF